MLMYIYYVSIGVYTQYLRIYTYIYIHVHRLINGKLDHGEDLHGRRCCG